MKVVVFTAIMVKDPDINKPIDLPKSFKRIIGWDYVLITNVKNAVNIFWNSGWRRGEIYTMEPPEDEMPPLSKKGWEIYANRWFKWHPDRIFKNHDIAIYVDGFQVPNFDKSSEWVSLTEQLFNASDRDTTRPPYIIQSLHPTKKCIYQEHDNIIACHKDSYENILKVKKYVKVHGYPNNYTLFWNGCYIYKLGSEQIQKVWNNLWQDMLLYTYRDQSLLMFEIWKNNAFEFWRIEKLNDLIINVDTNSNHVY